MSRIFLAAGHHPTRPGACFKGFCEHDEAVLWVEKIKNSIGDIAVVVPVGTLRYKADYINARLTNGDVAVEVHFNAAVKDGKNVGRGCETLQYPGSLEGARLALRCQLVLSGHFSPDRGCKDGWYRGNPERGAYFFLARTRCPAVIIEPEFIHRKEDIQRKRDDCCESLAEALIKYMGEDDE